NLIMPEPCPFLSRKFPVCAIVRPTSDPLAGAMAAAKALTADGLFIGQSRDFFDVLSQLAEEADQAQRGGR
ncbi:MAG: ferritin-like domain-containing protein, partial [Rhabdochlamydiaceae bacterium]